MSKNYKNHLSSYLTWDQKKHSEEWLLFSDNLGEHICIDETALSDGELFTLVSNGSAKTQKGCLTAVIKGTKSSDIIKVLEKIPLEKRRQVKEVSVDMANNMEKVARACFPEALIITDRFHVAKLINEAVQTVRIKHRWEAIEEENKKVKSCKQEHEKYQAETYRNGDTKKQLLARSRYLLFKSSSKWSVSQKERAEILFKAFPDIGSAYKLSMMFRNIYETSETREQAEQAYLTWCRKIRERSLSVFCTAAHSIESHKESVLNFFANRTTNALAETLNSKIKAFRSVFRGVRDLSFFLYRVSLILA